MKLKSLFLFPLLSLLSLFIPSSVHSSDEHQEMACSSLSPQQQPSRAAKAAPAEKSKQGGPEKELKKSKDSLIGFHNYYLEMRGVIRQTQLDVNAPLKGTLIDSVQIRVFSDSTHLVAVHYASKHGECRYRLPLNRLIRLEISKRGYVTKYIDVNTKVPPERKLAYLFPFDIDLFDQVSGLDVSALKRPIAKVKYDLEKSNFEYDEAFTNAINRDLKVLYKSYRDKMRLGVDSTRHKP
jgi:hypothetical protein